MGHYLHEVGYNPRNSTSDDDGGGLFGGVAHVVVGHTAVDTRLLRGDGR